MNHLPTDALALTGLAPDWLALRAQATEYHLPAGGAPVFVVADAHLGDARSPEADFVALLEALPAASMLVLLGDVFQVWLALPRFHTPAIQRVLAALESLRQRGTAVALVVGNREFFVPATTPAARQAGLPVDWVVPDMGVLVWGQHKWGVTHGDLANRKDAKYLRWRRIARGRTLACVFRGMPGLLANAIARRLERSLAATNRDIKVSYPQTELTAFAQALTPGLDGFLLGHFHLERQLEGEDGSQVWIVPDWHSQRVVYGLTAAGQRHRWVFHRSKGLQETPL